LASAAGIFGKISVDWMLMFSFSSSPPKKWILKDLLFLWASFSGMRRGDAEAHVLGIF